MKLSREKRKRERALQRLVARRHQIHEDCRAGILGAHQSILARALEAILPPGVGVRWTL